MTLWIVLLAATFGRGSTRPFRAAMVRLGSIALAALFTSGLLAHSTMGLSLHPITQPLSLFFPAVLLTQGAVLLALTAASGILGSQGNFERLLMYLPLQPLQRQGLLSMPSLILASFTILLVGWPIGAILLQLGANPFLLGIGLLLGVSSSYGLLYGWRVRQWPVGLTVPIYLYVQYRLVHIILGTPVVPYRYIGMTIFFLGVTALTLCCLRYGEQVPHRPASSVRYTQQALWWHLKKLLRQRRMQLSILMTWCMSLGIAIVAVKSSLLDIPTLGLAASVLVGSCVADIRGLSRRLQPPEIVALWGTGRFLGQQLVSSLALGAVAASPLVVVLLHFDVPVLTSTLAVCLGATAGLTASTLLVPVARDITAQFSATILCTLIVVGLPWLPLPVVLSATTTHILLSCLLLACTFSIEYRRNTYLWKGYSHICSPNTHSPIT